MEVKLSSMRQKDPERLGDGTAAIGCYRADQTRSPRRGETRGSQRELAYGSRNLIGGVEERVLRIDDYSGRRIYLAAVKWEFHRRYRKARILNLERPHRRAALIRGEKIIGDRVDGGRGDPHRHSRRAFRRSHF